MPIFEPQHTIKVLQSVYEEDTRTDEEKRQKMIQEYLEVFFKSILHLSLIC